MTHLLNFWFITEFTFLTYYYYYYLTDFNVYYLLIGNLDFPEASVVVESIAVALASYTSDFDLHLPQVESE